jgi:ketosteroid isomerase-like protein
MILMRFVGLAVAGMALLWTLTATAADDMNDSAIRGMEYAWNQAELHHDVKALQALLADNFVRVDNRGRLVTKAQYIKEIGDSTTESQEIVNEDILVHMYGDSAVAVSTYHVKGARKGKTFVERGRFIDTWVRVGGNWQCAANQETLVQP